VDARRRVRGYSLLEFGIVLGVIGILLSPVVVLAQGMLAVARTRRAGSELWGIAEAASHALARGRRFDPASGLVSFQPGPGLAPVGLGPTSPLCFNLAQVQGLPSTCRETGAASDAWGGQRAAGQTPTTASILDFLGGGFRNSAATIFVTQKHWDERTVSTGQLVGEFFMKTGHIKEGLALAFGPPPIFGLGNAGGFEFYIQNRGEGGAHGRNVFGLGVYPAWYAPARPECSARTPLEEGFAATAAATTTVRE
jgi:type II secretory pathway pseudopilin PulG